mgnify:CR=1 FL=1|tara:strand:- start:41772 stop:43013 length:1242 start_codon:yes stop_codon:yes gene_type:complete
MDSSTPHYPPSLSSLTAPPLEGMRVLDLSRVLAAPFSAMMLADLGADVIKVENPDGGDQTRHWGTAVQGGERTYYLSINRTKRSIAVNFSTPEGSEIIRDLARTSDILIENYMTGSLAKYGLDYESLKAINPGLIYCSVSGYGRTGPSADRPGYDSVIQAESGLMSVTGDPDGAPSKTGVPLCDITAGMYATQAILAAVVRKLRNGRGEYIDVALLDCTLANHASVAANALLLNKVPGRFGNSHADIIPQGMYPTSDGQIMFHVGSDNQFRRFCIKVLERPDMAEDARFATNDSRGRHRALMDEEITAELRKRPKDEWIARFRAAGIPAGLVRNVLEALQSDEAVARGMVQEVQHPNAGSIKLVSSPIKLREAKLAPATPPPLLGEHTEQILRDELGYDAKALEDLRNVSIIN